MFIFLFSQRPGLIDFAKIKTTPERKKSTVDEAKMFYGWKHIYRTPKSTLTKELYRNSRPVKHQPQFSSKLFLRASIGIHGLKSALEVILQPVDAEATTEGFSELSAMFTSHTLMRPSLVTVMIWWHPIRGTAPPYSTHLMRFLSLSASKSTKQEGATIPMSSLTERSNTLSCNTRLAS